MAFRRRRNASDDEFKATEDSQTVISRLLPELFTDLEAFARITVLDLGSGSAATLKFFSELSIPAQVTFVDALELKPHFDALAESDEPFDLVEAMDAWRVQLGIAPTAQVDFILLWDYLHYFRPEAIEALASALQPHIHRRTRGYGFGSLHSDKPIRRGSYAIGGLDQVVISPESDALPFSHSQQVIADNFVCLQIARGTLLQEGHLELLLEV